MSDVLMSLGVNLVLSAVNEAIKNPKMKEAFKKALLKVRDQITLLFPEV